MKTDHSKNTAVWLVVVGIPLVILLLIVLRSRSSTAAPNDAEKSTREIALSCTTDEDTKFHIHADLKIIVLGIEQTIPAGVGITPECMNPIHTHDASGKLHVESPVRRDFTLGDFFAVWDKAFSETRILDATTDADHRIRVLVNGKETAAFEKTVLRDDDQIVIFYEEKNPRATTSSR